MLRCSVRESGQVALPPLDVDGAHAVIGSGATATIRLPAQVAREIHVRIEGDRWIAIGEVTVDGRPARAGDSGAIGDGVTLAIGVYELHLAPAPPDAAPTPPQRTESLARELVRGLLGDGAAPMLEVERGPAACARRVLPPPDATVVIGRGDDATWVILDEDLSRTHAELHRTWDGVTIRDLDSKNGTRVDGVRIANRTPLRDGARVEVGNVVLRFRDPAERHLRGELTGLGAVVPTSVAPAPPAVSAPVATSPWPTRVALTIALLALAGLVWVLAT